MTTKKYIVRGKVQGVGFRYFVYRTVIKMDIKGRVKNLKDGTVEIIVTTFNHKLFLEKVRKGNFFCRVEEIEEIESNLNIMYIDFQIK